MKKILSILFATMFAGQALAYDFQCGDLYYNITSNKVPYTVSLTYQYYNDTNNYSGLTSVSIPENVTYKNIEYEVTEIGYRAFNCCKSLSKVTIPNTVKKIDVCAFCECSNLKNIIIPNSVTDFGQDAFTKTSLTYNEYDNALYLGNDENPYHLLVKAKNQNITSCKINPYTKVILGNNAYFEGYISEEERLSAFFKCYKLDYIMLPQGIKAVGSGAFYGCISLKSINIPNSVISIGENAFGGCSGLELVTIPNSVTTIERMAFDNNEIKFYCEVESRPDGWSIPMGHTENYWYWNYNKGTVFWGANKDFGATEENGFIYVDTAKTRLAAYIGEEKVITIPNTVTSIEDGAFSNGCHLTSITIPETVTRIGDNVFVNCENIDYSNYKGCRYIGNDDNPFYALYTVNSIDMSKFELNSNCKIICGGAFRNCDKPTSITIPESVVSICNNAFDGCSGLVDISIPNSVTYIEKSAFANCSNIAKLTFNTNAINDCFSGNIQLTEINIGNSVTNIAKSAFSGCNGLTSISIPNSVVSIDTNAFSGCNNLTSIVLPSKVASIGYNAFNCSELKQVICLMETPATLVADPFPNTDSIFVPNASVDIYSAAPFWRRKIILPLVSAESVNATQGSVSIEDDTNSDNTVIISATSAEHYHFVSWSDGNTDNPRTLTANVFTQLTALFEADENTVVVSANSATFGSVTGSGLYHYGDTATFTATPSKGYHFVKWNDDNTDNPRSYIVTNDVSIAAIFAGHTIVTDAAVAATCITTGLSEGSHCSVCGEIIVEQTVTPKAEHTAVVDAAVAATCTATGLTEGSHCSVCGKVIVAQKTIPIGKHTSVTDPAVAATTTSTGLTEGSHCSVCGKVIVAQTVIPMLDNGGENQGGNENQGGDNEGNENQGESNEGNGNQGGNNEGNENQGESNEGNGNQGGNNEGNENQGNENTNPSTAVAESAADNLQVYAHHNTIIVENATEEIRVYNAMGALVGRDVACRVRAELQVNATGVYIVKVGNVAKRVMVY